VEPSDDDPPEPAACPESLPGDGAWPVPGVSPLPATGGLSFPVGLSDSLLASDEPCVCPGAADARASLLVGRLASASSAAVRLITPARVDSRSLSTPAPKPGSRTTASCVRAARPTAIR